LKNYHGKKWRAVARKIENDDQFQKSLDWLLEKAKQLDHPLMEGPSKSDLMAKYDYVAGQVLEYQRNDLYQKFPHLRQMDEVLGLVPPKELAPVKEEPAPKKQVNLADWMEN